MSIEEKRAEIKQHQKAIRELKEAIREEKKQGIRATHPGFSDSFYDVLERYPKFKNYTVDKQKEIIHRLSGGLVDRNLLEKVVACLKETGMLDEDDLISGKSPVSRKEFVELFDRLDEMAGDRIIEISGTFTEYRAYFEYDGFKFIWNVMVGQGSACTLFSSDNNEEYPYREDLKIVIPGET